MTRSAILAWSRLDHVQVQVMRNVVLQVFLDCIEQFNLMVNSKGVIVHSELKGTLQMKAYLSGMPECKLGLNDKTMFSRQV